MSKTNEINRRLERIKEHYNLNNLLVQKTDQKSVAKYYRLSDFFYRWIRSRGGSNIHMSLSDDGKFHKSGFKKQAKVVGQYISDNTNFVLELGAGKVVNTKYLAKKFPDVEFTALDIPNRNFLKAKVPKNVSLIEGDYNDLSVFTSNSFDVVFAVETICYAASKEAVIKQVSRVLKPGGVFIILDVYEPLLYSKMTKLQRYVSAVVLAGIRRRTIILLVTRKNI
jgi:SAM-dependent methyltransferase